MAPDPWEMVSPAFSYSPPRAYTIGPEVADLNAFAVGQGTSYKLLKLLNPWLRDNMLTGKPGKTYSVLLPAEGFDHLPADNEQ